MCKVRYVFSFGFILVKEYALIMTYQKLLFKKTGILTHFNKFFLLYLIAALYAVVKYMWSRRVNKPERLGYVGFSIRRNGC